MPCSNQQSPTPPQSLYIKSSPNQLTPHSTSYNQLPFSDQVPPSAIPTRISSEQQQQQCPLAHTQRLHSNVPPLSPIFAEDNY